MTYRVFYLLGFFRGCGISWEGWEEEHVLHYEATYGASTTQTQRQA